MKGFFKTLLAAFVGTLVALAICLFMLMGFIGSIAVLSSQESTPVVPSSAILKIDFAQAITETGNEDPFAGLSLHSFELSPKSMALLPAIRAIEKASSDPAIKFIYLNLNSVKTGMAQLEEIRGALEKFRESGKPVIAYANNYSQGAYYLATVADKIYIQKEGSAEMLGIGVNMMFFKDLLDKLGIQVQLIRHGKFKAAAEQFIANTISEANREQNQEMINSIWNTWLTAISQSREIPVNVLNDLVNKLQLGNAQSMVEYNLVDQAISAPEMVEKLCTLYGVTKEKDLKLISLAKYAKATIKPNIKAKDKIAVLYADGEITMKGPEGIAASRFCPVISKIKADSSIKALVLRVNSPGGDAQAAEMINTELQLLRKVKPVIVSFGDYATSGGYWIAAESDQIFTDKTTLTGSIGVFSMALNYGKGLKKHLDINTVSLGTNTHSDMFSGIRPMDAAEQKYLQTFVEDIYVNFTDLVASGRDLPVSYVDSVGQGRVWTGADALKLKLADKIGGLSDAIAYTALHVGLDNYRIVEYPAVKSSLEKFMQMLNESAVSASLLSDPYKAFEKTYSQLQKYNGIKTYARIPYMYEFTY